MTGPVTMQVARSIRIRSRCLRCQRGRRVDSSAAARSDQRQRQVVCRYKLAARAQDARSSLFSDAHSPRRTAAQFVDRHRQSPNAEERRACWEAHTMVMYRCEPPHSRAHVIASARLGRSFDRRVRALSTKPATTALAMRPPRSPPTRHREGSEGSRMVAFVTLPKLGCVGHTQFFLKKEQQESSRGLAGLEPTSNPSNCNTFLLGQKDPSNCHERRSV